MTAKTETELQTDLRSIGACRESIEWIGSRSIDQAWIECDRGDWLIWILTRTGSDVRSIGYWCAERARQSAIRALPDSPERSDLIACDPIVDRATAIRARAAANAVYATADAAANAAANAAYAAAANAAAAYADADAAAYAAASASANAAYAAVNAAAAYAAARSTELKAIADHVRSQFGCPKIGAAK